MSRRALVTMLACAVALVAAIPASAGNKEYQDVLNQGEVGVYEENGASLIRTSNGISLKVSMATPEPGTYVYPDGATPGSPEVFTLWGFVFNHPQYCSDPCGANDLANPDVGAAVYNVGGHWGAGANVTISRHISVDEASFGFGVLTNPEGAEVHAAVAPHGWVPSSAIPNEFRIPVGSPFCGCWYVAIFK